MSAFSQDAPLSVFTFPPPSMNAADHFNSQVQPSGIQIWEGLQKGLSLILASQLLLVWGRREHLSVMTTWNAWTEITWIQHWVATAFCPTNSPICHCSFLFSSIYLFFWFCFFMIFFNFFFWEIKISGQITTRKMGDDGGMRIYKLEEGFFQVFFVMAYGTWTHQQKTSVRGHSNELTPCSLFVMRCLLSVWCAHLHVWFKSQHLSQKQNIY